MKNWLRSSQNPTKVSQTISGGVIALSSIIMFVLLNVFGISVEQADVTDFGAYLGMIAGGIMGIKGLLMKVVMLAGKE